MRSPRSSLLAPALLAAAPLAARAEEQLHVVELPDATTDWQRDLALPRFDPALGTLLSVELTLEGRVLGSVRFESQDARASLVQVDFRARLEIERPDGSQWLAVEPFRAFSEALAPFDGVVDFAGPSGRSFLDILETSAASVVAPPPEEDLALFTGPAGAPGELVVPARGTGLSQASGAGNLSLAIETMAGATVRVRYEFEPPPGTGCTEVHRRRPASLLVYPEFDNRVGDLTLLTVTDVACDAGEAIDVHFVYVDSESCLEFDRVRRLTPCDTLSLLTSRDAPVDARGWVYAYARDLQGRALSANRLIGNLLLIRGLENLEYSVNPFAFESPLAAGQPTDLDQDGERDLDGLEYAPAPERLLVPRFLGQTSVPGLGPNEVPGIDGELVLLNASRGAGFEVVVDLLVFNDNEEAFSAQYAFRCWAKPRLREISGAFLHSFLADTAHAPGEVLGAANVESGWFWIEGASQSSSATTLDDPAVLGFLVERIGARQVADLPFERCSRSSGVLLPQGPF
jgi:hypothetical protein